MKTKEDYLIDYESKLLSALSTKYRAVNKLFFSVYVITFLFVFLLWNTIKQISFLGASLELSNVHLFLFLPCIATAIYFSINYNFIRIARITREININSKELLKINKDSRPIQIKDLQHFEEGLTGLVISVARWRAFSLIKRSTVMTIPKSSLMLKSIFYASYFYYRIYKWVLEIIVRPLIVFAIYYSPLLILMYFIADKYDLNLVEPLIIFVFLSSMIVATVIYSFILFFSYFYDYIISLKNDLIDEARSIVGNFKETSTLTISTNVFNNFFEIIKLVLRLY